MQLELVITERAAQTEQGSLLSLDPVLAEECDDDIKASNCGPDVLDGDVGVSVFDCLQNRFLALTGINWNGLVRQVDWSGWAGLPHGALHADSRYLLHNAGGSDTLSGKRFAVAKLG